MSSGGIMYANGGLSISGYASSNADVTFAGYIQSSTRFICKNYNGWDGTLQAAYGANRNVVGGIIV